MLHYELLPPNAIFILQLISKSVFAGLPHLPAREFYGGAKSLVLALLSHQSLDGSLFLFLSCHWFIEIMGSVVLCCCCCLIPKLCPTLCNPTEVAHQAPLSMGFPRQEYQSGLSFSSPGDLSLECPKLWIWLTASFQCQLTCSSIS